MMRLIVGLLWTLALLAYLSGQTGRGGSLPASSKTTDGWKEHIEALGMDREKARENAYKEARKEIIACLRRHQPPLLSWTPSEEFIRKNLIDGEEPGEDITLNLGTRAKQWIVFLKAPDWNQLIRLDREAERIQISKERLLIAGRVFAGVLALLVVLVVSIRLDERTRGRYRRWLQAAGTGLVAGAWVCLWMFF